MNEITPDQRANPESHRWCSACKTDDTWNNPHKSTNNDVRTQYESDIQTLFNLRRKTASITTKPCFMRHTERHNTPFHQSTFNVSHKSYVVKYSSLFSFKTARMVLLWLLNSYCFKCYNTKMETFWYEGPLRNTAIWCLIQYRQLSIPGHHRSRHPNDKVVNIIYRLEDKQHCFYWYLLMYNLKMESSTSNNFPKKPLCDRVVLFKIKHLDIHISVKIQLKMHVVVNLTLSFPRASMCAGRGRACQIKTSCHQIRTQSESLLVETEWGRAVRLHARGHGAGGSVVMLNPVPHQVGVAQSMYLTLCPYASAYLAS